MLKKIIMGTLLLITVIGVLGYYYLSSEINDTFPLMLDSSKELYIESCESNAVCTEAINNYYSECTAKFDIKKVGLFSFQEEYGKFLTSTHKCIQDKSGVVLPGIWDYIVQDKFNG